MVCKDFAEGLEVPLTDNRLTAVRCGKLTIPRAVQRRGHSSLLDDVASTTWPRRFGRVRRSNPIATRISENLVPSSLSDIPCLHGTPTIPFIIVHNALSFASPY